MSTKGTYAMTFIPQTSQCTTFHLVLFRFRCFQIWMCELCTDDDYFIKFLVTRRLDDLIVETSMKILKGVFLDLGILHTLMSDPGTNFKSSGCSDFLGCMVSNTKISASHNH